MPGSFRRCLPIVAAVGAVALMVSLWPSVVSLKPVVTLDSSPRGASVFVNGRLAGATPLELADLPPGSYSLNIERDGYTRLRRNFVLGSSGVHISETLNAIPKESIAVNIEPEGSEIVLDGELRGHTPMVLPNIPAGWHELEVRKPNFATYAKRIELEANKPLSFKL